ncbi:MAG: GlsB/YeaQ/YmgE family stress response membrane protein [Cloacibacterium normanense]
MDHPWSNHWSISKICMPGNQNMGWLMTIILGIVGSIVGGFLAGTDWYFAG